MLLNFGQYTYETDFETHLEPIKGLFFRPKPQKQNRAGVGNETERRAAATPPLLRRGRTEGVALSLPSRPSPDPESTLRAPFLPWVSYFPRCLPVPLPQCRVPGPGIIFERICGTVVTPMDVWMCGWSLSSPDALPTMINLLLLLQ